MTTPAEQELERVLRKGSKSFHLASLVLPRRVRVPTLALYAFCRHADDLVDDAGSDKAARVAVDTLRARVDRLYAGTPGPSVVERAFADVVERFAIPRALPDALVEGMEWDASGRTYETLSDVRAYAMRVAGSVGLMMTLIMGGRAREVLARACDLGVGMQMTNIARDVGEDARLGRIYLPARWLEDAGDDPGQLLATPRPTRAVRSVVERLLGEAERHYVRADAGIPYLPADCRMSIRAARLVYASIGGEIARAGHDSVTRRAIVSRRRKLLLVARAGAVHAWRPRPLLGTPMPEAAGLLAAIEAA
ncbi:MAG: phytoene synthase [Labilithrix sp.]|nr:phytoene synthase [Labilithrix sp.]